MSVEHYIYQLAGWPEFTWNTMRIEEQLALTRFKQGKLLGKIQALGSQLCHETNLYNVTAEILASSEIESESHDPAAVRSSVERLLDPNQQKRTHTKNAIDGVVEMIHNAAKYNDQPLTRERLFQWHSTFYSGKEIDRNLIRPGAWRDDRNGTKRVTSGSFQDEIVHFQAPYAPILPHMMDQFLRWMNQESNLDLVLKAGIAHLWFLTIHPFDDANGPLARAITDMLLARSEGVDFRFYSLSHQILQDRQGYFRILEQTQKGLLDISKWLLWYLKNLQAAIDRSDQLITPATATKNTLWDKLGLVDINTRQRKALQLLLEGQQERITSSLWAQINDCSQDTAGRDIKDLLDKKILAQTPHGGRSTSYQIIAF